jgi:hypothetical protein
MLAGNHDEDQGKFIPQLAGASKGRSLLCKVKEQQCGDHTGEREASRPLTNEKPTAVCNREVKITIGKAGRHLPGQRSKVLSPRNAAPIKIRLDF